MAPQAGYVTDKGSDGSSSMEHMSLEAMLEMKREIDQKLHAMGCGQEQRQQTSKVASANRNCFTQQLQAPINEDEATKTEARAIKQKGQLYRVVFHRPVAVRTSPSLDSAFFRGIAPGTELRLFEWDSTRRWRRATFLCAKEALEEQIDDNSYCPLIQQALGPSTRARRRMEGGDAPGSLQSVCDEKDGWVLIEHPQLGQLLEALPDSKQETSKLASRRHVQRNDEAGEQDWGHLTPMRDGMHWVESEEAKVEGHARHNEDFEEERRILDSVEDRPGFREPALMRAVRAGSYEVARNLLNRGADVNLADAIGETAMVKAISSGRIDIVGLLLSRGADLDSAAPGGIVAVLRMTEDVRISALLKSWQGFRTSVRDLEAAVEQLDKRDTPFVAPRLGIKLNVSVEPESAEIRKNASEPRKERHDLADMGERKSSQIAPQSISGPTSPGEDKYLQSIGSANNNAAGMTSRAQVLQAPRGRAPGVRYRVVYKKVAVRELPDKSAKNLGAKRQDDIVEMFEWDESKSWRKIKIWLQECSESGQLREVEGWMLLHSQELGALLEEVVLESDDDEGAG
eukprot:TRINITY_DN27668_c0_g1_i1.p1 TRINITY_DN27668_c0_g1~~TRINITY_DN27668_c0_g1_i1.p1  ORF type:complete len:571 (+),score=106.61 TRINITY_DN27668_c0_g1_i1:81-1793(+)